MKTNMGNIDRGLRIAIALVIGVLFAMGHLALSSTLGIILAVVAGIFGLTALIGNCPLYSILGLSTCKVN